MRKFFAMRASALVLTVAMGAAGAALAQQPSFPEPPVPTPAFAGQTGAPAPAKASSYVVEKVVDRLSNPWAFAFMPNGKILLSERNGTLRTATLDGIYSVPIQGVPPVKVTAAESMHDLVLDPNFAKNRLIYFTYFAPPPGETPAVWPTRFFYDEVFSKSVAERRLLRVGMETIARARLSDDETKIENVEIIGHGAARKIVFAPDGTLFVTGADRPRFYDSDLDSKEGNIVDPAIRKDFAGRISRINPDGTIPKDNPFLSEPLTDADVYAFGIRDPEGAAINPATGNLWWVEHGPRGGDELNILKKGADYGWPTISYGRQYNGQPVGSGQNAMPGMEQPIYYWYPSIAPSGLLFYSGALFPEWKGDLFVGSMKGKHLSRLILKGDRVVAEEQLLLDEKQRIRDVRQGPDGAIYVITDEGALLRIKPKPKT